MTREMLLLPTGDKVLAGNWWPFPPPDVGTYDLRRVRSGEGSEVATPLMVELYPHRRVYTEGGGKTLVFKTMGQKVSKMTPEKGWQFRFPITRHQFRPLVVLYKIGPGQIAVPVEKRDISDQLPRAYSIEEARYIVRQIPDRWPMFWKQHVEYTEEQMQ